MKKYSLILSVFCLLTGCHFFEKEEVKQEAVVEQSVVQVSQSSSLTEEVSSNIESAEPTEVTLFDETLSGNLPYPKTSVPLTISKDELVAAMEEYYTKEYTAIERQEYQQPLDETALKNVQQSFDEDDTLKILNAQVRQIQFNLAGDNIYVAQVIVPMSQQEAQQHIKENDALLLNHTFSQLGNRLVMIAYYDKNSNVLLPVHLTNSSKPLFYYPE